MAAVFCFTSTGNSLYTAKRIAEKIHGNVLPMNGGSVICEDRVIGFVFPVFFCGLPRMVERFLSEIKISDQDAYVFAVATYGNVSYGVPGRVKQLLGQKGIPLQYAVNLKSVQNYIPLFGVNDSEIFRKSIDENIVKIAAAIQNRASNRIQAFTGVNRLMYRFYPKERADQHFTVGPACTGCAACQKVCPANNIAMEHGNPAFLHRCEHCLACVHICPACAMDWKEKTRGKARYRNPHVAAAELIAFNGVERT
ncbi:MAG: EFR1 family ferrodoxin [Firmicutes bacterium]|nr:EFR1 family ferrodoxin [Bacillota bacterium]